MQNKVVPALLALSLLTSGLNVNALPQKAETQSENDKIQHLLNRITFGKTYSDIGLVSKMGIENYIKSQLHPQGIAVSEDLEELSKAEALQASPAQLFIKYGRPAIKAAVQNQEQLEGKIQKPFELVKGANASDKDNSKTESKKQFNKMVREANQIIYGDTALNRIARAVESPRQLEEVMTDFWFNHFNISSDKGLDKIWVGAYEEKAIRPYVLGRFRDLLGATAHHAAMLFYLDNWQNSAPKASDGDDFAQNLQPNKKKNNNKGINENYARELMELHTLGVDGGYTQKDVTELARVLTGLGTPNRGAMIGKLNRQFKNARAQNPMMNNRFVRNYGQFVSADQLPGNKLLGSYFDPARHDFGDKVILGTKFKGEGEKEIEQVLDLLAKHPSTAKHISYQLAQYFVCDKPPASLVENLSQVYLKSDGDIATVLGALFHSNEFWDVKNQNAKFKSPYRFLISTLRATDTRIEDVKPAVNYLRQAGMPLYQCLTPDGYKNTQEAWLNPDNLVNRLNFATAFSAGRLRGMQPQTTRLDLVAQSLPSKMSEKTNSAIKKAPKAMQLALILGSPEFMKY
ncbi:MAG: DUF1800 domain-containing protein [Cyanobacteria bacterium TGS_CYA1]|nr:DUF1800 domain-containing protein [Cyanobacteria bacterium TGS_CYA1]